MVSPAVYVVAVVAGFIVLLLFFIKLGDILPKPRPSQPQKANGGYFHGEEDRNEIYMEEGLVHLEYNPRTNGITAQSDNIHSQTGLTVSNEVDGTREGAVGDRVNGELKDLFYKVALLFRCFSIFYFETFQ